MRPTRSVLGSRALVVVLALTASSRLLQAQTWCNAPGPHTASYADCALRFEGDRLVRVIDQETVAMADRFSALPLRRFVTGDSAARYAALYERHASRAGILRFAGGALLFAGSITMLTHSGGTPGWTRGRTTAATLMLSGVSIHLMSVPFQRRADDEATRAIVWNNGALHREP